MVKGQYPKIALRFAWVALMGSFSGGGVFAATPAPPTMITVSNVSSTPSNEKYIIVGDQYYKKSLKGLQEYMDVLREDNAELYAHMKPDLDELLIRNKRQNLFGIPCFGLFWAGLISGIALNVNDAEWTNLAAAGSYVLGGVGLIGGITIMVKNRVGPEEFRQFINKHNRLSTNQKMHLGINLNSMRKPQISLALRW